MYVLPVMAVIFNLPLTLISESVYTYSAVLLDAKNVCVAFGISLLSCIEAEILCNYICASGYGDHLQFNTYPDVEWCSHYSCVLLDPENVG